MNEETDRKQLSEYKLLFFIWESTAFLKQSYAQLRQARQLYIIFMVIN